MDKLPVSKADTVVNKRTMMIKVGHTSIANPTMLSSKRSDAFATVTQS